MKLLFPANDCPEIFRVVFAKLLRIMKLTTFLILTACLYAKADGYSQKISLSLENASVKKIFKSISDQSEYHFLYTNKVVSNARPVNIFVKNATIDEVLKICFEGQSLSYTIYEKTVIIKIKKPDQIINVNKIEEKIQLPPILISGSVKNEKGEPLSGVSIKIKNTQIGTSTNQTGQFEITVQDNKAVLEFSYVGYIGKSLLVGENKQFDVTLILENKNMEDLVVIGYGSARRKDFTGAVSSIKMENSPVALMPNFNALEALKGNVSGLNIGATNTAGGQPAVLIRGQRSISGSNDPLILLDGVIYLGAISDINPNDIASYDILKDAVAAAAYGSRSANGIIAITTKKGKTGKPVIAFRTNTGFEKWQNRPVMMKGDEWITMVNARNKYAVGTTTWLQAGELVNKNAGSETVWLDKSTQTGVTQDYQVSISGAAQNINYYLSSSYNDNKGIVVGDEFNRISVFGKINTKVTTWFELGVDANYSKRNYSGLAANIGSSELMSPYGVLYRDDLQNLEKYPYTQSLISPLWGITDGTTQNTDITNNFRLNTYAVVSIPWVKGLTYRVNLLQNLDKRQSGNFTYESYYIREGAGIPGRYDPASVQSLLSNANGNLDNSTTKSFVFDNIINYETSIGKHRIYGTLVATRDHRKFESLNATGSNYASNGNTTLGIWGLSKATVQKVIQNNDERSNIGYLARANYSFKETYFLTGSYRRDGASVFGADQSWANFAAVGAAWRISNENFLKNFKPLNNLKLKFSWGQNGNQGLSPYATLSQVLNGAAGDARYEFSNAQGSIRYGLVQTTLGNPSLGWEKTDAINLGFESAWLKNRLFVDMDVYSSQTTDQIFVRNIPIMTGFYTQLASLGQVNNSGIELTLRTVNIQSRDLNWTSGLTYWKNNNKLIHLYGEDKNKDGVEDDDIANNFFIGHSLGSIFGYQQDGIVQTKDAAYITMTGAAPGAPKYNDLDGNGKIDASDRTILGGTKENFRLNLSNTVQFKNFELYVMIAGIFGGNHSYLQANTSAYMTSGTGRFNDNSISKPYWTPENNSNIYPSPYFSGDSRFLGLQSRAFVRIQDVSLSYSVNSNWMKKAHINTFKLFVGARNLATSTNWIGGDPETGTTVQSNTFPVPSIYSFGANISF